MQDTYLLGLFLFAAFGFFIALVSVLQQSNSLPTWFNRATFGILLTGFFVMIYFAVRVATGVR